MYKSIIIIATFLLMATARTAAADYMFGAGYWDWSVNGHIRSGTPSTNADLKDDLHLSDDSTSYLFAVIEHPVPLLPNIRVATTNIDTSGSGTVTTSFVFNGTLYAATTPVDSTFKLDQTDVTLYYQLLDNVVGLDLGLTGRSVDGHASVDDGTNKETADFSGVIPLVYAGVDVQLPLTGLSLGAAGNAISAGSDSITDYNVYVRYSTDYLFGVEGGYRKFSIDIDDLDSTTGKMDFSGAYVNLYLAF
jgi:outer membrane protein